MAIRLIVMELGKFMQFARNAKEAPLVWLHYRTEDGNRAGKDLSLERKAELEMAKGLLSERLHAGRERAHQRDA